MTRAVWLVALLPALLAPLALRAADPPSPAAPVLRVEDVVRWHVAGVAADEIVRRIESAAVDFELDEEMVAELHLAGLPETVLRAMQERQAALHPTVPPPESAEPTPVEPSGIVLHLRGSKPGSPAHLRIPTRVPAELVTALALDDPAAVVAEVALYVACLRAPHVPSHWRGASPLGRDFATMPRHEMLLFLPLATAGPEAARGSLELDAPPTLEVPLDPADGHDLSVGVAARIGDRYYRLQSDTWEALVPAEHPDGLEIELEAAGHGVRVRIVRPPAG